MRRFAAFLLLVSTSKAATLFGPTPYLSQADSPFNLSGLGSTFFLEDFEDGLINTPGLHISQSLGGATVNPPGSLTDSVDADDGAIDGSGTAGHSLLHTGGFFFIPSGPPAFLRTILFEFNAAELGFVPNTFGFVWTDGAPRSEILLETTNGEGDSVVSPFFETFDADLGDDSFGGETSEDRFLGIMRDDGIASLTIFVQTRGVDNNVPFEIDHVQYGLLIPEPSIMVMLLGGILSITIVSLVR